jgi:hypothetical protein
MRSPASQRRLSDGSERDRTGMSLALDRRHQPPHTAQLQTQAGRHGVDRARGSAAVEKREVVREESGRCSPRSDKPAWRDRTSGRGGWRTLRARRHSRHRHRTVRRVRRWRQGRFDDEQHDQAERRERQPARDPRSAAERCDQPAGHRLATAAFRGTSASSRNTAQVWLAPLTARPGDPPAGCPSKRRPTAPVMLPSER